MTFLLKPLQYYCERESDHFASSGILRDSKVSTPILVVSNQFWSILLKPRMVSSAYKRNLILWMWKKLSRFEEEFEWFWINVSMLLGCFRPQTKTSLCQNPQQLNKGTYRFELRITLRRCIWSRLMWRKFVVQLLLKDSKGSLPLLWLNVHGHLQTQHVFTCSRNCFASLETTLVLFHIILMKN